MKPLKITVLTPSYNQGRFIKETIESVMNQNYSNIEHIVIDGGSTDETIEVLKQYPHLKWVSEADEGQSDALNKGLAMATGDIIGWLNSDDFYEVAIFQEVYNHFRDPQVDWIIGNTVDHYEAFNYTRIIKSPTINYGNLLKNPDITRQPGTFHRKQLLEQAGGWDKNLRVCMDFDLWVRLAKISTPKMIDTTFTHFRKHPDQKTTARNKLENIRENNNILKREEVPFLSRQKIFIRNYISVFKYSVKYVLIKLKLLDKRFDNISYSMRDKLK